MVKDLIKLENKGRSTYVSVAGIEIGRALKGVSFNQSGESLNSPTITATIDIREMLQVLAKITPEQLEEAKKIMKPYLKGYERTTSEDGDSSLEVFI